MSYRACGGTYYDECNVGRMCFLNRGHEGDCRKISDEEFKELNV